MTEVTKFELEELAEAKRRGYASVEEWYEEMDRAQEAAERNSERSFEWLDHQKLRFLVVGKSCKQRATRAFSSCFEYKIPSNIAHLTRFGELSWLLISTQYLAKPTI